jgi:hypothetical protein
LFARNQVLEDNSIRPRFVPGRDAQITPVEQALSEGVRRISDDDPVQCSAPHIAPLRQRRWITTDGGDRALRNQDFLTLVVSQENVVPIDSQEYAMHLFGVDQVDNQTLAFHFGIESC